MIAVKHSTETSSEGFLSLASFEEHRLPHAGPPQAIQAAEGELLTYVMEGAVAFEDSRGLTGVLHATEFEVASLGAGAQRSMRNASQTHVARYFQLWLRGVTATPAPVPVRAQHRFSVVSRRDTLTLVAAYEGRGGALALRHDAQVYSGVLSRGRHVIHALDAKRSAWLYVVQGSCTVGEFTLSAGQSAAFTDESCVSITARQDAEVLLVDLSAVEVRAAGQ